MSSSFPAGQRCPRGRVPTGLPLASRNTATGPLLAGFEDTQPQLAPPQQPQQPRFATQWRLTKPPERALIWNIPGTWAGGMLPLYAARIEDLGPGEFVKVDCAACHHVALLTPEVLVRFGLSPAAKVLDLRARLRCRGCGKKGRAVVSIKWRG